MASIPHASGVRGKAYRDLRGLSQESLAERAGLEVSTVRRFEAGNPVSECSVLSIARALEVTPATLYEKEILEAFLASRLPDPGEIATTSTVSTVAEKLQNIDSDTLERLKLLPGMHAGRRFKIAFENGSWGRVETSVVLNFEDFALEPGECLRTLGANIYDDQSQRIGVSDLYANGDTALGLFELRKSTRVVAVGRTVFGVTLDPYSFGGFHDPKVYDQHYGFLIEEIEVVGVQAAYASATNAD